MGGRFLQRRWLRSLGEAGRGVLTGFGAAALAKFECLELGLGLLRVLFGDVARAEAIAALCESMVFVVAQGVDSRKMRAVRSEPDIISRRHITAVKPF